MVMNFNDYKQDLNNNNNNNVNFSNQFGGSAGCFFNDGIRKVDFVICFKSKNGCREFEADNERRRCFYFDNCLQEGLEFEVNVLRFTALRYTANPIGFCKPEVEGICCGKLQFMGNPNFVKCSYQKSYTLMEFLMKMDLIKALEKPKLLLLLVPLLTMILKFGQKIWIIFKEFLIQKKFRKFATTTL